MSPSFQPRLVNDPLGDPGLFLSFPFRKRAVLFDLGDLHRLFPRDLLKITHVFVTHTHMDHFIGFDHLLRVMLGREIHLSLFGPQGMMGHVEGKLAGYCWNLVKGYEHPFELNVFEVRSDAVVSRQYRLQDGFEADQPLQTRSFEGALVQEPAFSVSCVILDHRIPCLGFSLHETFHVNILKQAMEPLGLHVGPWLREFKDALYQGLDPNTEFIVPSKDGRGPGRKFLLAELSEQIARIRPGRKIAYITDVAGSPANIEKIVSLVHGADHLFIEAAFLERDRAIADEKCHLTAAQAGRIAAQAGVKQFSLFHFSPRYTDLIELLESEARQAFDCERPGFDPKEEACATSIEIRAST